MNNYSYSSKKFFFGSLLALGFGLIALDLCTSLIAQETDPSVYREISPDSERWQVIRDQILDDYFYNAFILKNPQHLPQSKENPLGYSLKGPPWIPDYGRDTQPIPGLDIVGPDGLIYPNFTYAGVQGGIPKDLPVRATITKDNGDFASQLEGAVLETASAGGGVIQIESGTFLLKRPVAITSDHIVIRGRGSDANGTNIRIEYGFKDKTILWIGADGSADNFATVGPQSELGFQAAVLPVRNVTMEVPPPYGEVSLSVDGKEVKSVKGAEMKDQWWVYSTGVLTCTVKGVDLLQHGFAAGKHAATASVTWRDGATSQEVREFILDPKTTVSRPAPRAAIEFRGAGYKGFAPIATPLLRGTTTLSGVEDLHLTAGDFVMLNVECSPEWLAKHKLDNGSNFVGRRGIFQVKQANQDGTIVLNQPLRFAVDAGERTRLERLYAVQGCGIEDIAMESPYLNVLTDVNFRYTANCWAQNLRLQKPGWAGLWGNNNKWLEVRNLEVNDGWLKGGGMAYIGWEDSYDCLMDGVKGRLLRHAPNFQYSSSGCVIRNGDFEDSDGQFHSGWPHENLVENCSIKSLRGNGSYGFGFLFPGNRQPGPRNVLYHNDISSENLPGLFVGGPSEASLFLYNRIHVKRGPAVYLQYGAFDHTFMGNYFITNSPQPSAVFIASPDCTGNEFINNTFFFGPDITDLKQIYLFSGAIPPSVDRGNVYGGNNMPGRPSPKVKSLYEWQMNALHKRNNQ